MLSKNEQLVQEAKLKRDMEQLNTEEGLKAALLDASLEETSQKAKAESHFNLKALGTDPDDWKKIYADYKRLYPDKPDQNNTLIFDTQEDAINFFTSHATSEPPRTFLVYEVDQQGNRTGFNLFSCGNNKLYKGSLKDIQSQLQADLKNNPEDLKTKHGLEKITRCLNPVSEYKVALQQAKDPVESVEQQTADLPNPFNTRPKSPFEKI